MKLRSLPALLTGLVLAAPVAPAAAQSAVTDSSRLTVERIYASRDFAGDALGPIRWLDGDSYLILVRPDSGGGRDVVRVDAETGRREVLIRAAQLTAPGDTAPMAIEDIAWTPDFGKFLVYTNSQPVWRQNTRGDYWVFDRGAGTLNKLGGPDAKPSTLMFAKFAPGGAKVGYVREYNLWVEDLATGALLQLTTDGRRDLINGTFDWVYEEELDLRDGWRWSPDGSHVAFWQLTVDSTRDFDLINNTDSLYSFIIPVQYPKVGEPNSAARVGVVADTGGAATWLDLPGDPRNHYPARIWWSGDGRGLVVQQLNRKQNTMILFAASAARGAVRPIHNEQDRAWLEVVDDFEWLDNGRRFLWVSERTGWEHVYVERLDGGRPVAVTRGEFDVVSVAEVDAKGGWLYYIASPTDPTQRYLWRARLDGSGRPERLSPAGQSGTHAYNIAPGARYAVHTWSSFGVPPVTELVRLPDHKVVRPLAENAKLHAAVGRLARGPSEFVRLDVGGGISLNAVLMKPPGFDPARKYPVLFYVYGGPGSSTVQDAWGGSTWLWHALLAQHGVIVASVDNRGTGNRGAEFKKVVYGRLGVIETEDQAAAARVVGRLPGVDSGRMGIWGWSYGGFMTLNALFRHPDVYRMGMAVAPVTHWKYYDNIYTERYNGLITENQAGYDAGSPLTYADSLRGKLLLVHGTGDDNVHYQNSEALINRLVQAKKQFELMSYPNRNHGIFGGNTTVHLRTLLTEFALRELGAGGDEPPPLP
ncbi:MAG TPA: S9 family peptidase [Gemmatimonadales bacterium]|nr:S9 family peptidase [Gemmatimonadales bacterium]